MFDSLVGYFIERFVITCLLVIGAVRVSLGYHSTTADCTTLLRFLTEEFLDRAPEPMPVFASISAKNDNFGTAQWLSPLDPDNLFLTPSPQRDIEDIQTKDGTEYEQFEHSGAAGVPRPIMLAAIFVYPIKSCAGN